MACRWQTRVTVNTQPLEASLDLMRANNPVVIPRNHKVEQALKRQIPVIYNPLKI